MIQETVHNSQLSDYRSSFTSECFLNNYFITHPGLSIYFAFARAGGRLQGEISIIGCSMLT